MFGMYFILFHFYEKSFLQEPENNWASYRREQWEEWWKYYYHLKWMDFPTCGTSHHSSHILQDPGLSISGTVVPSASVYYQINFFSLKAWSASNIEHTLVLSALDRAQRGDSCFFSVAVVAMVLIFAERISIIALIPDPKRRHWGPEHSRSILYK